MFLNTPDFSEVIGVSGTENDPLTRWHGEALWNEKETI